MQKTYRVLNKALLLGLCLMSTRGYSQSQPKEDTSKSAPKVIESFPKKYLSASTIDFGTELQLPFESLTSLGSRIENARRVGDAVGLGNAARELSIAEEVAGKAAPLASKQLMAEAVVIAEDRGSSLSLKALSLIVKDADLRKRLETRADEAGRFEEKRKAQAKSGERSRGITGNVRVINTTDDYQKIIINGNDRFVLGPYQNVVLFVGDGPFDRTHIKALGSDGSAREETFEQVYQYTEWRLSER